MLSINSSYKICIRFILFTKNLYNKCFKPVFVYKISFSICVLELWINKGYIVVKKLVWNHEMFVLKLSGIQNRSNWNKIILITIYLLFRKSWGQQLMIWKMRLKSRIGWMVLEPWIWTPRKHSPYINGHLEPNFGWVFVQEF